MTLHVTIDGRTVEVERGLRFLTRRASWGLRFLRSVILLRADALRRTGARPGLRRSGIRPPKRSRAKEDRASSAWCGLRGGGTWCLPAWRRRGRDGRTLSPMKSARRGGTALSCSSRTTSATASRPARWPVRRGWIFGDEPAHQRGDAAGALEVIASGFRSPARSGASARAFANASAGAANSTSRLPSARLSGFRPTLY